mmetsp:Transcript_20856/g.48342  ORF Transcript_20856/g.48342 Transcript_20856/m.48342 type:complete len:261 (+) Transcript_20856:94-876(+)
MHDGSGTMLVGPTHVRPAPPQRPGTYGSGGSFVPPPTGAGRPPSQAGGGLGMAPPSTQGLRPPPSSGSMRDMGPAPPNFALIPSAIGTRHDMDSNGIPDVLERPQGPQMPLQNWKQPPPPVYDVGARVEALFKDELYDKPQWFPGTLVQCNEQENRYVVRWDYNGEHYQCKLDDIRHIRQEKPWDWHPASRPGGGRETPQMGYGGPVPQAAFTTQSYGYGAPPTFGHYPGPMHNYPAYPAYAPARGGLPPPMVTTQWIYN